MQPETNEVSTKTWLEASKDITIRAYIESYMSTLNIRENLSPSTGLYDALRKISVPHPLRRAVTLEPRLEMELQAWDTLSDEALRDFELGLK
jgi:hypothetical protein